MNSSQQPLPPPLTAPAPAAHAGTPWCCDEDVALGCECADPALQIERWGQEAPGPLRELY